MKTENLSNILKDGAMYVKVNVQATRESKSKSIVIEPEIYATLEQFTEQIMLLKDAGYVCTGSFNGFEINTDQYKSQNEIVEAYHKYIDEDKEKNETKNIEKTEESKIDNGKVESNIKRDEVKIVDLSDVLGEDARCVRVNAQATRESKNIVIEPELGTSLEVFAKQVMSLKEAGYVCTTNFNGFEINADRYKSEDEIIAAYDKDFEEKRKAKMDITEEQLIVEDKEKDLFKTLHSQVIPQEDIAKSDVETIQEQSINEKNVGDNEEPEI